MHKELKFRIISECMSNGVSVTCKKYSISRTIYYRWLKRYRSFGIDGLDVVRKDYSPPNKTSEKIEKALMDLVKIYPSYGPKALGYLLEELGYKISSSAVFNILKRKGLTNKYKRLKYSGKSSARSEAIMPSLEDLNSGEGWIFWVTDLGSFGQNGNLYVYTLLDLKSQIACSRLYQELTLQNFEDLLAAVALSVATTLDLKSSFLCFFKDDKIVTKYRKSYKTRITATLKAHGKNLKLQILENHKNLDEILYIKGSFTSKLMALILPFIGDEISLKDIKKSLQNFIREYNLNFKIDYSGELYSPVEYHNKMTNTKMILPLWAYIDREY